jgi:septal ring factor EnvC (AmiA/AmiB activator)
VSEKATETTDELLATIARLREEVARLKEEIRHIRRDNNEAPPHYL